MAKTPAPKNPLLSGANSTTTVPGSSLLPAAAGSTNPTSSTSDLALNVQGVGAVLGLQWGVVSVSTAVEGMRTIAAQAAAGNTEALQMLENLQNMLYAAGFYKGQTAPKPKLGVLTGNSDLNAFKSALEGAASSGQRLGTYLQNEVNAASGSGQSGSGTTVIAAAKEPYTVYTAADIQATADATAKSLIGRVLNASEMQGVLGVLNSESFQKGQADAAAVLSQQQQDVTTQQAVYGQSAAQTGAGTSTAAGAYTPQQVAAEIAALGGTVMQQQVGATLVTGIESNGQLNDQNPKSTASGLFQFLDTTWNASKPAGAPDHAGDATFQQQVQAFITNSAGNNFQAWSPDLGGNYTDNIVKQPLPGSAVANAISTLGPGITAAPSGASTAAGAGGTVSAVGTAGTEGQTTDIYQNPVLTPEPPTPTSAEATTNYIETQLSPQYQTQNLLKIFQLIESNLKSPPTPNVGVRTTPISMKPVTG